MRKMWYILLFVVIALAVGAIYWYLLPDFLSLKPDPIVAIHTYDPKIKVTFTHELDGRFLSLDREKRILTISGFDGEQYSFSVPEAMIVYNDADVVDIPAGAKIQVQWNDMRTIDQVATDHAANPMAPLNDISSPLKITRLDMEIERLEQ